MAEISWICLFGSFYIGIDARSPSEINQRIVCDKQISQRRRGKIGLARELTLVVVAHVAPEVVNLVLATAAVAGHRGEPGREGGSENSGFRSPHRKADGLWGVEAGGRGRNALSRMISLATASWSSDWGGGHICQAAYALTCVVLAHLPFVERQDGIAGQH